MQLKAFGIIVAWSAGVIGLILLIGVIGYGLSWWAAPWQGKLEARQQIESGANRIAKYDTFFNQCASIQGIEATLDALDEELATADKGTFNYDRIQANITGNKSARLNAIAQYNADANKEYTGGQFRDSNLPFQIPATAHAKGDRTRCTA